MNCSFIWFINLFVVYPQLDSHDIGEGKTLKVNVSEPKTRLFVGNIPKTKDREDIEDEFKKMSGKFFDEDLTVFLSI